MECKIDSSIGSTVDIGAFLPRIIDWINFIQCSYISINRCTFRSQYYESNICNESIKWSWNVRRTHVILFFYHFPDYVQIVELLVEKKADIEAKNAKGLTPLAKAFKNNRISGFSKSILKKRFKSIIWSITGEYGMESVEYLLSQGADINAQDNDGHSLIHEAVIRGISSISLSSDSDSERIKSWISF